MHVHVNQPEIPEGNLSVSHRLDRDEPDVVSLVVQ